MVLSPIFDETYKSYLSQIAELDLAARQMILGYEMDDGQAVIPFFNKTFHVSSRGIFNSRGKTPNLSVCVILCKYLLMCPDEIPQVGHLEAFKDFRDSGPLIQFFANTVEGEVVRNFSGNVTALDKACLASGGKPYKGDFAYQIKYRFWGLPRVPVYLFFNDAEEGFAARCSMLFESRTEAFLDMESVAMLGGALSRMLSIHIRSDLKDLS